MAKCAYCGSPTELYSLNKPICIRCADKIIAQEREAVENEIENSLSSAANGAVAGQRR
jgi:hypothetical protein